MNYLLPGGESLERMQLLLSLSQITSEDKIAALTEHYVNGLPIGRAAARFGTDKGNLSKAQSTLESITATVELIKELD